MIPASETELALAVRAAVQAGEALLVEGNGSKSALLRPVDAPRRLSTRALTGITLYRPSEMVISARAGTPIPEIEAALAEKGQMIAAEPPDLRGLFGTALPSTLGGMVATNLSGPRRISAGSMRDLLLGIRVVDGRGEVVRSGGRVLKNVTGLDLCKLLAGSHGTVGVLTEVTLKVQPSAEASATLVVRVPDLETGRQALSAGLTSPFGVSGAAIVTGAEGALEALLRLEDFQPSIAYRSRELAELLAPFGAVERRQDEVSRALWRAVRDAVPLRATEDEAVWRLSLRPSAGPAAARALQAAFGAKLMLDWGGGLLWVAGPADERAHGAVMQAAAAAKGSFTLFRGPERLRRAVPVLPEEGAALLPIARRVKTALDPAGVFNPGRMRALS
ncbi:FAD-binding protein [Acetobacteraceae bacterium H6797]|nr:FAD-binding protein [Acetobacteraceae bacterium H6797]